MNTLAKQIVLFVWVSVFTHAWCLAQPVSSLPEHYEIKAGQITIRQSDHEMIVEQQTDRGIIDFESFNIAEGHHVRFEQPNASAITLNRVVGQSRSEIFGGLSANGQVFLVNPNGVFFSESSHLDVGSVLVSTLDIDSGDFMDGNFSFAGQSSESIVNLGHLVSEENGYIVLIGAELENHGELSGGTVALNDAQHVVVSLEGELVGLEVFGTHENGSIENTGQIKAQYQALIESHARNGLEDVVVNNTGIIQANGFELVDGEIVITAQSGTLVNSGEITASSQDGGDGGRIALSAPRISHQGQILAEASGVGDGGSVSLIADQAIAITDGANISVSADTMGDGGQVINYSHGAMLLDDGATISANGGTVQGDGGFVEVSGAEYVAVEGSVSTEAVLGNDGLLYIDPTNITIDDSGADTNGSFVGGGPWDWIPDGVASSTIDTDNITALLATTNVTIDTAAANTGADAGVLSVDVPIDLDGSDGQTLTLRANTLLSINADICDFDGGLVCSGSANDGTNLVFDTFTNADNGAILTASLTTIDSGGGSILFNAQSDITLGSATVLRSQGGSLDLSTQPISNISVGDGVSISSQGGNMTFDTTLFVVDNTASFDTLGGDISIAATQGIDLNQSTFANVNHGTFNSIAGGMRIPDAGIQVLGDLVLLATEINDVAGHTLALSADSLLFSGLLQTGNTVLNTTVGRADIRLANTGGFSATINELDAIELIDLNADGYALQIIDQDLNFSSTALTISSALNLDAAAGSSWLFSSTGDIFANANFVDDVDSSIDDVNITMIAGGGYTQADNVEINSYGGDVSITSTGDFDKGVSSLITSGDGNVLIQGDSVLLRGNVVSTSTDAAAIDVRSASNIRDGANPVLDLEASAGGIVLSAVSGIDIDINAANLDVTNTASGDVDIVDSDDVIVADVNASNGTNTSIESLAGSITINDPTSANILNLRASDRIVLPDAGINILGGLSLVAGAITDADNEVIINTNSLSIITDLSLGDMQVTSDINTLFLSVSGTNSFTLLDNDTFSIGGLILGSGDLDLGATNDFTLPSTIDSNGLNSSTLTFRSLNGNLVGNGAFLDSDLSSPDIVQYQFISGGDVSFGASFDVNSYGGNILVDAVATVAMDAGSQMQSSAGQVIVSGGDVFLGGEISSTNTLANAIQITSGAAINDVGSEAGVDISAPLGGAVLIASSGVDVDTDVAVLDVVNSTSGSLVIEEIDGLTLSHIDAVNVTDVSTTTNGITIANGALAAVDDLTLRAPSGVITLPDTGIVTAGNVLLRSEDIADQSGRDIDILGQSLLLDSPLVGGDLTVNTRVNDIDLSNTGTNGLTIIEVDDLSLTSITNPSGSTTLSAVGELTLPDSGIDVGGDLTLSASDIRDGDDTVNIVADSLNISSAWDNGDVLIDTDINNLIVNHFGTSGLTVIDANSVNLASLTLSGGAFDLIAEDALSVTGEIDTDGANGSILRFVSNTSNIGIGASLVDTDTSSLDTYSLTFDAAGDFILANNQRIESYGGDIAFTTLGDMRFDNGSRVVSGAGRQVLSGGGNINLRGALESQSTSTDAINITSLDRVFDGGQAFIDVLTLLGGTIISAQNGISIDTDVRNLTLINTVSGDIEITNTNVLQIDQINTVGDATVENLDNDILFNNSGTFTLQNFSVVAENGDVVLPDGGLSVPGSLLLRAADIYDATDRGVTVTADTLSLETSATGGDVTIASTIAGLSIVNNGTDELSVVNAGDLIVSDISSSTGDVNFDVSGSMILPDSVSVGGNLRIAAEDIRDMDNTLDLVGGSLRLVSGWDSGDVTINTDTDTIAVENTGANSVTVNDSDSLNIVSIVSSGGDMRFTAQNLLQLSANVDLDGAEGSSVTFQSLADAIIISGGIMDSNRDTLDTYTLNFISQTGLTFNGVAGINDINTYGGDISLSTLGDVNIIGEALIDAGLGKIAIDGASVFINGILNSDSIEADALSIQSSGQIMDDADGLASLTASLGGASLEAQNGIALDTNFSALNVGNDTSGDIQIVNEIGLRVSQLNTASNSTLGALTSLESLTGDLIIENTPLSPIQHLTLMSNNGLVGLPDAGLTVEGDLRIESSDLQDASGRVIDIAADNFVLQLTAASDDIDINTRVNDIALSHGGSRQLSINDDDSLSVSSVRLSENAGLLVQGFDISLIDQGVIVESNSDASLTFAADNDLFIDANMGGVNGASDYASVVAFSAQNTITMADDQTIDAGTGTIDFSTQVGSIRVSHLLSNSDQDSAIRMSSANQIEGSGDSEADLTASNGGISISAGNGILQLDGLSQSISINNSVAGNVDYASAGDIVISGANVSGDLSLMSNQDLILPEAGLTVPGDLQFVASNISNVTGSPIRLASDNLIINGFGGQETLSLSLEVNTVDVALTGGGNISIDSESPTIFQDLSGDDFALYTADGNINLRAAQGDLLINGLVQAQDQSADGVRAGIIDIAIDNGNFILGDSASAALLSLNLGDIISDDEVSSTAIRVLNTNDGSRETQFTLGQNNNSVQIAANSGDVFISALGLPGNTQENRIVIGDNVIIESTNQDGVIGSGVIILENIVDLGAQFLAADNRRIELYGRGAAVTSSSDLESALAAAYPPSSPPKASSDLEELANPLSSSATRRSEGYQSVDAVLGYGSRPCSDGMTREQRNNCNIDQAYHKFLSTFLIGGELPDIVNRDEN